MSILTVEKNKLKELQEVCFSNNIPFVSFRYPQNKSIKTFIQTSGYPIELKSFKELNSVSGFIITPFFTNQKNASFVLEPDITIDDDSIDPSLIIKLGKVHRYTSVEYLNGKGIHVAEKSEFIRQVKELKNKIAEGKIKKAVLSRIHIEPKNKIFDITRLFIQLCIKYPNAFIYLFQIPMAGCWIGATPEPLVLIKKGKIETISLAGTQKLDELTEKEVQWPSKEIEEQDIVTRYIESVLKSFQIDDFQQKGPYTQVAGNLLHLKTRFLFDENKLANRIGEFIEALHPTPSICGLPKDEAYEILEKTEPHHREYYTGLLGPMNMENETSLFVNLRCMKVLESKLAMYLGAGITSGSDPESEWEETNQKKMTLLSVIEKLNFNR